MKRGKHLSTRPWILSVNMGYGHERAAYGLKELAHEDIVTANSYPGMPQSDKKLWNRTRRIYERVSRLKSLPIIGKYIFATMDAFQRIDPFYPRRDLSEPTLQLREVYRQIRNEKLCKHLIEKLSKDPRPLISTFFLPAYAAEEFDYPGDIYIVCCDADIARAWAPLDPRKSRIKYFAPTGRVVERLQLYGVPRERIILTGFPLPPSLIHDLEATQLREDLFGRLERLDPKGVFHRFNERDMEDIFHDQKHPHNIDHPFTITYSVGGAGAQQETLIGLLTALKRPLLEGKVRLAVEAGTHRKLAKEIEEEVSRLDLTQAIDKTLFIFSHTTRAAYFEGFAKRLRNSDVLWTKPSELSFYTGLGLPIIMNEPLGSQEHFNRHWLESIGSGARAEETAYAWEWLQDWRNNGYLATMAWRGFNVAPTHGTFRIANHLQETKTDISSLPFIV
ncbi:MAG: hypothetical protein KC582_03645 [Candidatus Magasanikbacteria bacterium]|nr:hypothetical protein [Candidatus Magasanikbacteria bacterium]USN52726.1 MAG: hypothetical protein H6759_01470 [Candidatus Nomurabacteria bacterium]